MAVKLEASDITQSPEPNFWSPAVAQLAICRPMRQRRSGLVWSVAIVDRSMSRGWSPARPAGPTPRRRPVQHDAAAAPAGWRAMQRAPCLAWTLALNAAWATRTHRRPASRRTSAVLLCRRPDMRLLRGGVLKRRRCGHRSQANARA